MNDKEMKWRAECSAAGFEYLGKSVRKDYSVVKCNVCGAVDEYNQVNIRRGQVRCKHCHETKIKNECLAEGFEWLTKIDKNYSSCRCLTCGHVDTYDQSNMRDGKVKCSSCHEAKMKNECLIEGFEWLCKVDGHNSLCRCLTCGHEDSYNQGHIRDGRVKCSQCQLTKYQRAVKYDWTFVNHFCNGNCTFINLKHKCSDAIVKVHLGAYLKGRYDCHNCMHTHYSDPSYFYVIQVEGIIKLGISNRPDQRYTQYGLPDDASIIEHLRIPLETKRDALVVESYAKKLVKDYKIPTEISKQVFTKSGYNECYAIDSLGHLLAI